MRTAIRPMDQAGRVLFGRLRGTILALLAENPSHSFYLREMVRLTGASPGALQRELGILVETGLLIREKRGRQVYYQINTKAPIFPELRSLVRKTMSGADVLRSALAPLAGRIHAAVVFGSMARGTLTPKSDIDLLVVGDLEPSEVFDALKPAEEALGREINAITHLPAEFRRRKQQRRHFVESVRRGPTMAIIGNLNDA